MDLSRVAVTMGKIIKLLDELEKEIYSVTDVEEHWDDLCLFAYICRLGIMDRIQANPYMLRNPACPIKIPTGLFGTRKETIESGVELTIGRILKIAGRSRNVEIEVESVLKKGRRFMEIDSMYNSEEKRKLIS